MNLINVEFSSIEPTRNGLLFHFNKDSILIADSYVRYSNTGEFYIECSYKNGEFQMTSDSLKIQLLAKSIMPWTHSVTMDFLYEDETFRRLMQSEYEEYRYDLSELIHDAERFNLQTLIDKALDDRDFEEVERLVEIPIE